MKTECLFEICRHSIRTYLDLDYIPNFYHACEIYAQSMHCIRHLFDSKGLHWLHIFGRIKLFICHANIFLTFGGACIYYVSIEELLVVQKDHVFYIAAR